MTTAQLSAQSEPRETFDRISLRRLVLIRWVAIAGQAVTLLVVHYAFDFSLPLLPSFAVVACSGCRQPWAVELRHATARCPRRFSQTDQELRITGVSPRQSNGFAPSPQRKQGRACAAGSGFRKRPVTDTD